MQTRQIIRLLAVAPFVAFASVAFTSANWSTSEPQPPVVAHKNVGVPTGAYVDGVAVHRFPSITVTARRSDVR